MSLSAKLQFLANKRATTRWLTILDIQDESHPTDTAIDSQNNIYTVGASNVGSKVYAYIVKTSASGGVLWAAIIEHATGCFARAITVDNNDNCIVAGRVVSGNGESFVAKYSPDGTDVWIKRYSFASGQLSIYGIDTDSSGNIICTGISSLSGSERSGFVLKLSSDGVISWAKHLDGAGGDEFYSVKVNSLDDIVAIGSTTSGVSGFYALIAQYTSSGTLSWHKVLGTPGGANATFFFGADIAANNDIVVVGYSRSGGPFTGRDALIARYNSEGTLAFQELFGGALDELFDSVAIAQNSDLIIVGRTNSDGAGDADALITKFSSVGAEKWQRTFGGTGTDGTTYSQTISSNRVYVNTNDEIVMSLVINKDTTPATAVLSLPSDGGLTGLYGDYTYASSTLTSASGALTDTTTSVTDGTVAFVEEASSTLTSQPIPVGQTRYAIS